MPDENNVILPVAPVSGNQNTAAGKGESTTTPQFVPLEEFNKLKGTTDYLAAELRKMRDNKTTTIQTETPPITDAKPQGKLSEVEQLKAELRAKDVKALQTKRDAAIKTAVSSQGLDPFDADLFYDHIIQRYDKKITATDEKVEVEWEDPTVQYAEKKLISVDEFVANLMKTKGDRFKKAPNVPNGNTHAGNKSLKQNLSTSTGQHQLSGKTFPEIMAIAKSNQPLFQEFLMNHRAEYDAIKNSHMGTR